MTTFVAAPDCEEQDSAQQPKPARSSRRFARRSTRRSWRHWERAGHLAAGVPWQSVWAGLAASQRPAAGGPSRGRWAPRCIRVAASRDAGTGSAVPGTSGSKRRWPPAGSTAVPCGSVRTTIGVACAMRPEAGMPCTYRRGQFGAV